MPFFSPCRGLPCSWRDGKPEADVKTHSKIVFFISSHLLFDAIRHLLKFIDRSLALIDTFHGNCTFLPHSVFPQAQLLPVLVRRVDPCHTFLTCSDSGIFVNVAKGRSDRYRANGSEKGGIKQEGMTGLSFLLRTCRHECL